MDSPEFEKYSCLESNNWQKNWLFKIGKKMRHFQGEIVQTMEKIVRIVQMEATAFAVLPQCFLFVLENKHLYLL